jgi:hypothetical protein
MKNALAGTFLALTVALLPALAAAADPAPASSAPPALRSLRHLVFSVNVATHQSTEYSGGKAIDDPYGGTAQSEVIDKKADADLVCDVVAATGDNGLVVDITETGADRHVALTRVGIHADGELTYLAPGQSLNEEEAMLLKFLARNFIGPDVHAVGDSWSVQNAGDTFKSTTKFSVSAVRAPDDEDLNLDESFQSTGARGYTGVRHGRVSYDPTKLVPLKAAIQSTTRAQQSMQQYTTVVISMNFSLKEDSFSKH